MIPIPPGSLAVFEYPADRIMIVDPTRDVVVAYMEVIPSDDPDDNDAAQLARATLMVAAPGLREAAERLLGVIADPIEVIREMEMDNAVQAMSDAIAASFVGGAGGDVRDDRAALIDQIQAENRRLQDQVDSFLAAIDLATGAIEREAARFEELPLYQKWGRFNWPLIRDYLIAAVAKARPPA